MISKGKRKHLVWLYSILSFYRQMGNPKSGIDVFKLAQRGQRLSVLTNRREPTDLDYFTAWTNPPPLPTMEGFHRVGKIMTEIIAGVQRRQSQQIIHKPRVVSREIDHSDSTLPRDGHLIIPFPDKGPL